MKAWPARTAEQVEGLWKVFLKSFQSAVSFPGYDTKWNSAESQSDDRGDLKPKVIGGGHRIRQHGHDTAD